MSHEPPTWKTKLRAFRLTALASLTPEEAEARVAADRAEVAARALRREARAAQALLINQRAALGDTPEEIAGRVGISVAALRRRARRAGHFLAQRKGFRRLAAWVSNRHVETLDRLAATWGMSREKALEELIAGTLAARMQRRAA
jgi:hypothetical protein